MTLDPPRASSPALASGGRVFTARPSPAIPLALLGSGALLAALLGAAVAHGALLFAAFLLVAAIAPCSPRPSRRELGFALAYAGVGWCIFASLRVPLGARVTSLYLPGALAFVARLWALRTEGALRFVGFPRSVTAVAGALDDALDRALRTPGDHAAIDRAVVALAAAPRAAIPEEEAARRAFWINAYNALTLHAGCGRASNRLIDIAEIFRTRYEVAGVPFTLDDIEHGMLRDGAASPLTPWARMGRADPRRRWSVPLDPRVHFALNCGAYACPKIRVYSGEALDAQLEGAEQSFLGAASRFDPAAGVIETSRILAWYAADFGGQRGVRARLGRALDIPAAELSRARLSFSPYDWTSSIT